MEETRFFAVLDQDNKVINAFVYPKTLPKDPETVLEGSNNPETVLEGSNNPETVLEVYGNPEDALIGYDNPETLKLQEYSYDKSITNNPASIGYTYNSDLNVFIPPCPFENYVLNTETFEWERKLNDHYDVHGDGTLYMWNGEGWDLPPQNTENS